MINIDIDADLNWVDDVAIAGRPDFWSWILIDEIDEPWIFFRQIDSREAATHGLLVIAAPVAIDPMAH